EHPAMEKFTRETYGIMVYQEQIMQIASEMAGFTMGEADILRRAMGKKDRELMAKQREKFITGCRERNTAPAKAERVWELMEKFAGYGFNKSHAAAYGLVAYQTAYFKANYPVEFMAALLTSEMGDTDKIVKYIEECRAMGIRVEPPDVNVSAVQFTVAGDTIRFGLAAIKNVGEAAMESILTSRRAQGAFGTLEDFCARVDLRLVNRRVVESLIKAGAFDSLGLTRAHLLATTDAALESGQRQQRDQAEGQGSVPALARSAAGPRPRGRRREGTGGARRGHPPAGAGAGGVVRAPAQRRRGARAERLPDPRRAGRGRERVARRRATAVRGASGPRARVPPSAAGRPGSGRSGARPVCGRQ